jgi:hypothetical protein
MIVYGTKATLIKSDYITEPCPNCKTNSSIQINIYQRYAHIFWIPFFPIGKTGVSVCAHCKQVLKSKDMPASLRLSYENLKLQSKIPIWNFAGIGIVAVIVIAVIISDNQTTKKINQLVMAPKAGDVLQIKVKEDNYTLYKVTRIYKDSVYLVIANFQTNQQDDLDNIATKGYDTVENALSKAEYTGLNTDEKILDIDRK